MELSRVQRWLIANQCRILERTTSDEAQARSYRWVYEALERGYEAHYAEAMAHIELNTLSPAQCREVANILDLYLALQAALERLDDGEGVEPAHVLFPGFDPQSESRLRGYAIYLRHSPEDTYAKLVAAQDVCSGRAMLEAWTRMYQRRQLTGADVREILSRAQV